MSKTIQIELNNRSINKAIKELRQYSAWIQKKEIELRKRLAELGRDVAEVRFNNVIPSDGDRITVRVEDDGTKATIYAEGTEVVFIEFGTGAKFGYGHPTAGEYGFGPGTWSDGPEGKHHWNEKTKKGDYKGWWYGEEGKHTYGNPPAMGMYIAVKEITENVTRIATEVFNH